MEPRLAVKTSSVSPRASQVDLRSSSVLRQTETIRALGRRRDVTPRLQQTPTLSVDGSSLQSRSRTASPSPSNIGQSVLGLSKTDPGIYYLQVAPYFPLKGNISSQV